MGEEGRSPTSLPNRRSLPLGHNGAALPLALSPLVSCFGHTADPIAGQQKVPPPPPPCSRQARRWHSPSGNRPGRPPSPRAALLPQTSRCPPPAGTPLPAGLRGPATAPGTHFAAAGCPPAPATSL